MKTFALTAIAATLALAAGASAQYRPGYPAGPFGGYPGGTPTVSPYLNIVGRGNPAINYYGITRPQIEFRNAIYGSAMTGGGPTEGEDLSDPTLRRGTGHAVLFNNLSHFYSSNPAMGAMARPSLGAGRSTGGSGTFGYGYGVPAIGARGYTPPAGSYGAAR